MKSRQGELFDARARKPRSPRGGRRAGAGRPPKGRRAGAPHKRRPAFKASEPLHVVLRVLPVLGVLRRRAMFRAMRRASLTAARREDFHLVHLSLQRTHVHLIVEARHRTALARGMQGFQIAAARYMNAEAGRHGQVFADRYHAEIIASPRQARHTLAYVLNNWRRHREDRGAPRTWLVDPFSTGWCFAGWKQREGAPVLWQLREGYEPPIVWTPRTWLLQTGWRRHGLIDCREVPG